MYSKDDPNTKLAVKVYGKHNNQDAQLRHFRDELKLKNLSHPNIIKLLHINENGKLKTSNGDTKDVRYAVLELAPNGNFLDYIVNNALDESIVRYYFKQLAEAVGYMHNQGICHRDLKLENLLLDESYNLKISDFGFSTTIANEFGDTLLGICKGTPGYMAPEMINIDGYNYITNQKSHKFFSSNGYHGIQTDVFALGVILFSLLMGRPPFKIADINDPLYRLLFSHQFNEFWAPWDQFASQNNYQISQDFKDLFVSLVAFSPSMRLSINEILSSNWMIRNIPTNAEVGQYMSQIKAQIDEFECQQQAQIQHSNTKRVDSAEETKEDYLNEEFDILNDSSLSGCSQINDDDEMIMKDLQEIESEFQANNNMNGSNSFNHDEEEDFDVDLLNNSTEFTTEKVDEIIPIKETQQKIGKEEKIGEEKSVSSGDRATAIVQFLETLTEVDTEVRTSVPTKMLSFLEQYSNLKNWKIVKIYNYVLLKFQEASGGDIEFALKFDQVANEKYAIKYLKYDEMSFEQFHSVGSFILDLISPYC